MSLENVASTAASYVLACNISIRSLLNSSSFAEACAVLKTKTIRDAEFNLPVPPSRPLLPFTTNKSLEVLSSGAVCKVLPERRS